MADRRRKPSSSDGRFRGAAWLSSARAVRCRLKCHNERNPHLQLPSGYAGHSGGTASASCEEGGDDVKSARPLRPGRHTCYNGGAQRAARRRRRADPLNPRLSSDRSLQPDLREADSLVIAHQPWRGEYVPALYTPPAKPWKLECLKSVTARSGPRVRQVTGAVVTKVAVLEVRLEHLLLERVPSAGPPSRGRRECGAGMPV